MATTSRPAFPGGGYTLTETAPPPSTDVTPEGVTKNATITTAELAEGVSQQTLNEAMEFTKAFETTDTDVQVQRNAAVSLGEQAKVTFNGAIKALVFEGEGTGKHLFHDSRTYIVAADGISCNKPINAEFYVDGGTMSNDSSAVNILTGRGEINTDNSITVVVGKPPPGFTRVVF